MPLDLRIEDILTLKKPHACGANAWRIYRLGVDIGLKCEQCGRSIMIPRTKLDRRVRQITRDGKIFKPTR